MTLAPGTQVLHYRVLRAIGSGGMGVVYEAEDTKLGRRVALKFLPPDLARDPIALERFAREARAASALNHPHICTIHAIEEAGGRHFIAMELLDGEPLDRRLAERQMGWDALLDIAIHLADALDAAHQRGIVHRDIKPANVVVTRDGRAKVLDFGVAKMAERSSHAETIGVTAAPALTSAGTAVGTVAYMSPEQARGEDLDARSDIFSACAVLYEMFTGRRAFDGKTTAVIFERILGGAPDPPRAVNETLPPRLEDLIMRGLERDRDLRIQSAADLRAELKRLKRDASAGRLAFVPAAPAERSAALSSGAVLAAEVRRHKPLAAVAAAVALAITGAAAYGLYTLVRGGEAAAPVAGPPSTMTISRLTTSGDVRGCGAISPDGKYVVYCDFAGELRVRQVATGATVDLDVETGNTVFSPDGNFVYVSASSPEHPSGVLWRLPSLGGERLRIATNIAGAPGVSPDGERIAFVRRNVVSRETSIVIADATGGNERTLVTGTVESGTFEGPGVSWSLDGRLLAMGQSLTLGGYRQRPVVVDAQTGDVHSLGDRTWAQVGRTAWLPGSRGVLFAASERVMSPVQFWIASYPEGRVVRLTNDQRGFGERSLTVTADGSTIATVPTERSISLWSTSADASEVPVQWTSGARVDGEFGIAAPADGRVYFASEDGADLSIWTLGEPGASPRRLTREYGEAPSTPADGRFVAFQAMHEERYRIWRMDPDGTNARVLTSGEDDVQPAVSPDGRWIYYAALGSAAFLNRVSPDGGDSQPLGTLIAMPLDVSPDGTSLLVALSEEDGPRLAVVDADSGAIRTRLPIADSPRATFGRTADVILYVSDEQGVSNLWEQPIAGGAPRQLTRFTSGWIARVAYSHDRSRLFFARGSRSGDVVVIRNFQ